ncbi:MFS transporter [Micromonospora sp. WMMD1102]|uniref:MFS transporter n=1 Tax=Micromonospora sp. WMMD1102 TaxID=3016105 RepID=UPI002414EB3A|nr:MFS transporter [Micromonospora sp. WMMD1102]MDG4790554.1 MFS transporter [Micromonospora sp. WMMD1102]
MSFATADPAVPADGPPDGSRWRDVYLAAGARAVSSCGDFLAATVLALTLQSAGAGGLAVSGVLLAAALPLVLLAPLTGRLADRVDSRTLLVCAGAGQAAVCVALAFAESTAVLMLLAALLACGLAVTQPTLAALLPELVRRSDLPRASAVNQTASSVGILLAPALAGLLVGQFGARIPLLLDAGGYLGLIAAGLLLRTRRGGRRTAGPTGGTGPTPAAAAAWRLRRDPLLAAMVLAVAATVAGVGAVNVIEVFFVRETLHASTTTFGLVSASWTAGVLIGAWLLAGTARRARDDAALVRSVLVMLGVTCLLIGLGATVPAAGWLVLLWLVGGIANGGLNVFANLVMVNRVPPQARGRAFAAQGAAIQGAGILGYLAGGIMLAGFPPRPLVAVTGLAGLAVVLAVTPVVLRAARRERAAAPEQSGARERATLPTRT